MKNENENEMRMKNTNERDMERRYKKRAQDEAPRSERSNVCLEME